MKKKYSKTKIAFQAILVRWALRLIYNTSKWNVRGKENYNSVLKNNKSVIISSWHGNLLVPFMHLA